MFKCTLMKEQINHLKSKSKSIYYNVKCAWSNKFTIQYKVVGNQNLLVNATSVPPEFKG